MLGKTSVYDEETIRRATNDVCVVMFLLCYCYDAVITPVSPDLASTCPPFVF